MMKSHERWQYIKQNKGKLSEEELAKKIGLSSVNAMRVWISRNRKKFDTLSQSTPVHDNSDKIDKQTDNYQKSDNDNLPHNDNDNSMIIDNDNSQLSIPKIQNEQTYAIIAEFKKMLSPIIKGQAQIKKTLDLLNNQIQQINSDQTYFNKTSNQPKSEQVNNYSQTLIHSMDSPDLEALTHQLISSGPNPRLYSLCLEIFTQWSKTGKVVNISDAMRKVGQSKQIVSFQQIINGVTLKKTAKLLNDLFIITKNGKQLYAKPSELGIKIFKFAIQYYSPQQTSMRLQQLLKQQLIKGTRKQVLLYLLNHKSKVSNDKIDREPMARFCNIAQDNLRQYIIELVQLGFIVRIPEKIHSNRYSVQLFDSNQVSSLLQIQLTN